MGSGGSCAAVVAPDVFVVKGIPKGDRKSYKLWEEGQHLKLIDPATESPLPGIQELREEVRRLQRELESLGKSQPRS